MSDKIAGTMVLAVQAAWNEQKHWRGLPAAYREIEAYFAQVVENPAEYIVTMKPVNPALGTGYAGAGYVVTYFVCKQNTQVVKRVMAAANRGAAVAPAGRTMLSGELVRAINAAFASQIQTASLPAAFKVLSAYSAIIENGTRDLYKIYLVTNAELFDGGAGYDVLYTVEKKTYRISKREVRG